MVASPTVFEAVRLSKKYFSCFFNTEKFKAFGWDVIEIDNGNNIDAINNGLSTAKSRTGKGKPICVILKTVMGNGVDFMMHTHAWHGKAPNDEQLAIGLEQNPETVGDY